MNRDNATVSVHQAAMELGMSDQSLREYMKRGLIDIGYVMPAIRGEKNRYKIFRYKIDIYTGKTQAVQNIGEACLKAMNQNIREACLKAMNQ